jgi:pyruvate/2-oxoglutarate dehydrogenase complex dihydrolipoamide acyltransferase (E2) component
MYEIRLPKLGMDMTEARIVRWLMGEGAEVKKGDSIVEIETDKVVVAIEAGESGTLSKILLGDDSVAEPGEVIGVIE